MEEASQDTVSLQLALGQYALVFALKLVVYWLTSVMALLAEALHTLSDLFISGFLLIAIVWSRKEADEIHMFGYGRAQNVAATLFIASTAYKLYEEAIPRLFHAGETGYQHLELALGVIVLSMLIAAAPLVKLLTQRERGPAAKAQLIELINDQLGLIAALVGTLFIVWGQPLADPIATLVVATLIVVNGARLFKENLGVLLGRSPGPEFLRKVEEIARSVDGVQDVRNLRAEVIGPETVHAGMTILVPPDLSVKATDRIAREVRERVHQGVRSGYCYIQVRPSESQAET